METLTKTERLVLINQFLIMEKLGLKGPGEDTYRRNRIILEGGYAYHYYEIFEHLSEELEISACNEVREILRVYNALNFSYNALPDKSGINSVNLRFVDYDNNQEFREMRYILDCEDNLDEPLLTTVIKNRRGGTGEQLTRYYRKMIAKWKAFNESYRLSEDQIKEILNELPSSLRA